MATSYPTGTTLLLVGTKRGLFVLSSPDREHWTVEERALEGHRIYNAVHDQRNGGRIFAADNGDFFGSFLQYSDDLGQTWHEPERGIQFPEDSGLKLENIWIIQPGRADEPHTVYAGVDPASLWISTDGGITWDFNPGLANHPTRDRWNPGAGGMCLHSIVLDPANKDRMWVGISAVGVMRTDDGGQSWTFANKNTRADFNPDIYPEFGQCVHRLIPHSQRPDTLYQQNHCGVYKSENAGDDWEDIRSNLPGDFGFPMALDAHNPETIYTVAVDGEHGRANYGEQFVVYRSQNAGGHWERLMAGLPQGKGVKLGVLRHGMCADTMDPCGVYVGTNTGQLFASNNRGDSWQMIADFLPPIYSVTTSVVA
jgi:photosystem II stability/assembly factor-like uncharacterized protein